MTLTYKSKGRNIYIYDDFTNLAPRQFTAGISANVSELHKLNSGETYKQLLYNTDTSRTSKNYRFNICHLEN